MRKHVNKSTQMKHMRTLGRVMRDDSEALIVLRIQDLNMIVSALQYSGRDKNLSPSTREWFYHLANELIKPIAEKHPAIEEFYRLGFDPDYDVERKPQNKKDGDK